MPHKDQKYIEALINGDRVLMEEIYQKFGKQCLNFVRKNGGNVQEANDIFQECLVSIILRANSSDLKLVVPFGGYLYVIYRRKWIDWIKKHNKTSESIVEFAEEIDEAKEGQEIKYDIFKNCFKKLSDECKNMFKMRFNGMSSKEIALKLDLAPNNIDQKFYTCREALRKKALKHPLYKQI